MQSVTRVMQRIAEIEAKFGKKADSSGSFADTLQSAENNLGRSDVAGMVTAAARRYGVDDKLALAVASAESSLRPDAVSPAGAVGVMQLMPETAQSLGVKNIHDPRENIDAGVRYLRQMLNTFGGDASKAIAAYNAGPEAVRQYGGVPPYSETQAYVNKVLNNAR